MLKTIMDIIMTVCFLVMIVSIVMFYQTTIGKAIVCTSALIAVITYFISDRLEDKEEKEEEA